MTVAHLAAKVERSELPARSGRNDSAEAPNRPVLTPGAGSRARTDDLLITNRYLHCSTFVLYCPLVLLV